MAKLSNSIIDEEIPLLDDVINTAGSIDEEINLQEKYQPQNKWSNFKCVGCGTISDMFQCKSRGGSIICPKCNKLN